MSEKKGSLKLTTKTHTGFGIASFILGIASIGLFVTATIISAFNLQSQQYQVGIIEAIAILSCVIGILYGLIGESTKETFKIFAHLGLIINILIGVFHLLVLTYGF